MRIVATITATLTALAGLVVAGPAARALVTSDINFYGAQTTVHTHNGKAWHYSVTVYPSGDGQHNEIRETLLRSQSRPVSTTESHEWFDTIDASYFHFDTNTGNATVTTPPSVAALTTLNLTFTATSRHNVSCTSGAETDYFGNLSGRATLRTQLKAGGTVGAQHVTFPAGKTEIVDYAGCVRSSRPSACTTGVTFQADGAGLHGLWGFGPSAPFVEVSHDVALSNPAGASRQDAFMTRSAHPPAFNARKHILQIWAADTGAFTGTGRFFGGKLSKSAGSCSHKGVSHTQYYRTFENPTFRNGVNHPLVAHTNLVGRLTEPNTAMGYYEFETWK